MRLTAPDLLELGVVDEVIPEPLGGAHTDPEETCRRIGTALVRHLEELEGLESEDLIRTRRERFRALGAFEE